MRGRTILCLYVLFIILLMAGCGETEGSGGAETAGENSETLETSRIEEDATVISVALSGELSENITAGKSLLEYAEKLEEWSGGSLKLEIFDGGRLGGDAEILAGVRQGTIGIHQGSNTALAGQMPELYILETPGIFDTLEEFNRVFSRDGTVFPLLQECYREQGYYLLNIYSDAFRETTSNVPVMSVSDLSGLRMRTMENEYQINFWENLGVTAVPYSFTELYIALEQNVVSAAEGPLNTSVIPSRLYEVQDYLILTDHTPAVMVTTVNLELWESLSEEQQDLLQMTFNDLKETRIAAASEEAKELVELCEEYGMTVLYPDEELKESIHRAGLETLEELRDIIPQDLMETFLTAAGLEDE